MSYITSICTPLINTLEKSTTLPKYQLAGHVANLGFWMNEVTHCFEVIDGYSTRFELMKRAQEAQRELEGLAELPLQRGVKDNERNELRQQVRLTAIRFLERCFQEQLIDQETWQNHQDKLFL